MKTEEKALIKAKKIECWIGFFFLIPPILGVIAFVFCLFDNDGECEFARMSNLSSNWTAEWSFFSSRTSMAGYGGGMSAAPIYLALMALAGAYLIKDSLKYLFMTSEEKKEVTPEVPKQ